MGRAGTAQNLSIAPRWGGGPLAAGEWWRGRSGATLPQPSLRSGPLHHAASRHGPPPHRFAMERLVAAQLASRAAHELRQLLLAPPFAILLLLGLASAVARLWAPAEAGSPTGALIARLIESFQLVPATVSLFFSGELFWAEREKGIAPIVAATPAPSAVLFLPKLFALAVVLLGLALVTALTGAALQALAGHAPDFAAWATHYVLPKWRDWLIFACLAMALQSIAPNKLAGWGFIVLYLIATLAWLQAEFDPRFLVGGYPGAPLPGHPDAAPWLWGWSLAALAFVVLGCIAAGRGKVRS
jgi:hypothetical protein